ncbi:MAG: UDP-N-acetylmuramate dehydrogenase [Oscillospiraceae bacterium]|nr:UDP-N-acetylmuramate dehydrogenase [Oscillospiraceae bacterium]
MPDIQALCEKHNIAVQAGLPMSRMTSFRIGGLAEWLVFPQTAGELQALLRFCAEGHQKPLVFGNGSNLLVKDSGIDGVVISTERLTGIKILPEHRVYCEAGRKLSDLCLFAQENGLAGLEFAYGIPGTAGGAAFMNAGAYGGEMKDVLHGVSYLTGEGEIRALSASELKLGYRRSVFMENGGTVLGLTLQLRPGGPEEILADMREILRRRKDKQPLEYPSAGSVFRRPEGHFASELIERCGLKGRQVGGAQVSEKHAGFIINRGGARAADVRALIALVQTVVESRTGILLEPEIRFV